MTTPSREASATDDSGRRSRRGRLLLLASVFAVGGCGLIYELVAGAVASYLVGNSVEQYSLVIGAFLAAMGAGSYITQWLQSGLLVAFLTVQLIVGVLGGFSGLILFAAFAATDDIRPVVLAVTAAIGFLVGMEIPLMIRVLRQQGELRVAIAQVMTVDYLGAVAASVAFPFFVVPLLGLVRAALAFGMLNVLVASFGTAMFFDNVPGRRLIVGNLVAWLLLGTGLAISNRATSWFEDRLYQDEIILAETTPYQRIVITRWANDIRLHLDGHLQFSSVDEYRYHEALVLPAMTTGREGAGEGPLLRVLILGGGDGLAVRQVSRFPGVARIDLVDIDRRVVELFRDLPLLSRLNDNALQDDRVRFHAMDAMTFLRQDESRYEVILMDLPDPSRVETNKLYTSSFFGLALKRLTPRGALVTQATSPFYAPEAFWCIANTLEAAAANSKATGREPPRQVTPYHVYVPSFGDWGFVMVHAEPEVPTVASGSTPARFLTPDVFNQAIVFPTDSAHRVTRLNTLDDPVLIQYHGQGWARWSE